MKQNKRVCRKIAVTLSICFSLGLITAVKAQPNDPRQNFSVAGFYPESSGPRKVYNFNPGWKFSKGDIQGAEKKVFNATQ